MASEHPPSETTEAIRLRRGLSLYKQPKGRHRGSPYWYARAAIDVGGRKVHARSTRTTDRRAAEAAAEDFWAGLLIGKLTSILGGSSGAPAKLAHRFDRVADQWLDSLKASAGTDRRKLRRWYDLRKVVLAKNGLAAFFGREEVASITTNRINAFLAFAAEKSTTGELKPSTKRNLLAVLRGVLNFALDEGMISSLPRMPRVKQQDNPRSWFTPEEYRVLNIGAYALARHARKCLDESAAALWRELQDFVPFMVNSFLRPSGWAGLKHKHIRVEDDGPNPHLVISLRDGKVKPRTVYTLPGALRAYRRIVARRGADPEAYVFLPGHQNRETALAVIRKGFNELMKETGTSHDGFGKKRVIYSLRHSALMFRVLHGDNVDLLALARNAGTSVGMLQRFYCSHLPLA